MNMTFISSSDMNGEATSEIYNFFTSRDEMKIIFLTKYFLLIIYKVNPLQLGHNQMAFVIVVDVFINIQLIIDESL